MQVDQLPKYHELFQPTLFALDSLGGSASLAEINDAVMAFMKLDPEMLNVEYDSGHGAVLPDRMSWARSYLKGAGYLKSGGRGIWLLTDEGRTAAGKLSPSKLRADVIAKIKAAQKPKFESSLSDELAGKGDPEAEFLDWKDQLLAKLKSIEPAAFERLAQRLLRESGFVKVEVTGKTGDGGIDGTGILQLSLMSFHVLFQCKRYQGSVGAGAVRDFRGAMMGRTDKGLIITTGTFSPDARREATRDGAPPIDLIDGDTLCDKLKELSLGVETRMVEEISIKSVWFDDL
jgi:restriction system protein